MKFFEELLFLGIQCIGYVEKYVTVCTRYTLHTVFKDKAIIKYFSSIEQPYVYTFYNERFFKNWSLKINFNNYSLKIQNDTSFQKQYVYLMILYMNNQFIKLISHKNSNTINDNYKKLNFEIVYLKNKNITKYLKNTYSDSKLKSSEVLNALMIKNSTDDLKLINSNFEETTFKDTDIITLN